MIRTALFILCALLAVAIAITEAARRDHRVPPGDHHDRLQRPKGGQRE